MLAAMVICSSEGTILVNIPSYKKTRVNMHTQQLNPRFLRNDGLQPFRSLRFSRQADRLVIGYLSSVQARPWRFRTSKCGRVCIVPPTESGRICIVRPNERLSPSVLSSYEMNTTRQNTRPRNTGWSPALRQPLDRSSATRTTTPSCRSEKRTAEASVEAREIAEERGRVAQGDPKFFRSKNASTTTT